MIDKRLGAYRITEEIGAGGMATVYRAYQPSMDRHVAIKVIRGHALADPTMRDRFRREAKLIARLEHPHLLPVYDFDGDHEPPYIVMRYLEGGTLRQVAAKGALPFEEVLYTLGQVASALDYAHRQGVVHRDLKPSNVMIDKEGNAFVTDFGIARVSDAPEQLTGTGHLIGTPAYMSPEQARGLPDVDAAADRYALGVIAFELLTGSTPYAHDSSLSLLMMHLNDPIPSARERREQLPAAIDAVIAAALAKDRAERPSSAARFVADLAKALKTRSTDAPTRLQSITQVLSLDQLKAFEEKAKAKATSTAGGNGGTPATPPSDQQRQVTTLSFDAGGLAELVYESGLDDEAARARLDALWARFDEIVREQGGVIQQRTSDIGVALWGRARISEDDPERAVRAALKLREAALEFAASYLPAGWKPSEDEPLPFCVGATTGPVLLERDTQSGLYTASGAALMVASRVREAAVPGEILIAHDTFTLVRGVFSIHPHDPLRLRGRREPLDVYIVSAAKPRAFRLKARGIEGVETRMVGRENELRVLQEALTLTLEDKETQVVTVVGEAGIGKSRLLFEFSNWTELMDETVWLFEARATQPSMLQPFSLTRDLFSSRFQILDSDPLETVHAKFVAGVAEFLGPESGDKARHMGQLVGFDFSSVSSVAEAMKDGEAFRRKGLDLLGEFFAAACRVLPAVLYIEDIHWADDRSLDLLNLLVRENAKLPLFVLCMARPSLYERRPQWGEGQHFHERVQLEPLSQLSSRRLVRELLKKVPEVPPELRDLVVERADGNPYYVEELIRALIDDGVVVKGETEWSVDTTRLSSVRIPPTLTGILQSRLDTLPPGLHQVLQRAAVLGRVFWDSAAIHLSRTAGLDEDEVQAMLEELRRREMILRREESSFAGTVEYVFRHAILRDVTYETIVPRQRRALHKSVGNWLLEQGGERAREHTALVAEHYERAGEATLAASQLQLAARSAISVGAFEEAIATLEKARGLVAERGDDPVRILVDCTLGEVLSIHGDLVRGRQVLLEALPAARRAGDKLLLARILGNLVRNCLWSFDHTSVHTYLDEAVPLAREIADDEMLVFMLRQSANSNLQDFERAQADIEESIEIAQRIADRKALSAGWNTKGNLHMTRQDWSEAHAAYDHSLELAKADGDLYAEQMMHSNKAICYAFQGRFDDGEREIKESLRQARVLKLGVTEAQAMEVQGFLELRRGKEREAEVLNHQALALYREHGIDPWSVLIILGVLEARKGDRDRGLAWIGAARKAAAGTWGPEGQPYVDVFWEDLRGPLSDEETQAKIAAGESLEVKPILDELLARPVER